MDIKTITNIAPSIIAFYLVIAAGFIIELFGCRLRDILSDSMIAKHVIAFLLLLFLVVLTNPVYSEKNIFENLGISVLIYIWFMLTTHSHYWVTLIVIILLMCIFLINSLTEKYTKDKDEQKLKNINKIQIALFILALVVSIIGFLMYLFAKKQEFGKDFNINKFFLSSKKCRTNLDYSEHFKNKK